MIYVNFSLIGTFISNVVDDGSDFDGDDYHDDDDDEDDEENVGIREGLLPRTISTDNK